MSGTSLLCGLTIWKKETSSLMTKSVKNGKHALPIVAQQYHVTIQNENSHLEVETDDKYALHTLTTITATTPITIRNSNAMIHLSVATCIKGLTFTEVLQASVTLCMCATLSQSASISCRRERDDKPGGQSLSLVG
jgi:hypothetical protein